MKVTILLPLSRKQNADTMIKQVANLALDIHRADLVVVSDREEITEDWINVLLKANKCDIKLANFAFTRQKPIAEGNIARRRIRIAEVFNVARGLIPDDSDFVFVMEDDTVASKNALLHLWASHKALSTEVKNGKIGIISGLQVGRWGFRMLGAWRVDNVKKPRMYETVPFTQTKILERVDAAGLYCFIVPRQAFIDTEFRTEDPVGPDVHFGLDLRKNGYHNFIDWTVQTGHLRPGGLIVPDKDVIVVRYEKQDGEWKRTAP